MQKRRPPQTAQARGAGDDVADTATGATLATLDLHGNTKDQAISKMTFFFSEVVRRYGGGQVLIITGSGSHSNNGPVLRQAVKATLDKRQMTYTINPGRGSFNVDATSGHELYADNRHQPIDTKLVMAPAREQTTNLRQLAARSVSSGRSFAPKTTEQSPLPSDVAADDAVLNRVKLISVAEASTAHASRVRSKNELERATSLSLQEEERQAEQQKDIERIIALSLQEQKQLEAEQWAKQQQEIERAIELSAMEEEEKEKERQAKQQRDIEQILALSLEHEEKATKQQSRVEQSSELVLSLSMVGEDEEDGERASDERTSSEQALSMSLVDPGSSGDGLSDLAIAIRKSLETSSSKSETAQEAEEQRMINVALALSMESASKEADGEPVQQSGLNEVDDSFLGTDDSGGLLSFGLGSLTARPIRGDGQC